MELIRSLNWVDVLVIIIVIRISYVAFCEGLSHEIFPVMTAVASVIICLHYYLKIGGFITENLPLGIPRPVSNFVAFLVLSVTTGLIFKLVKVLLDRIIKVQWHPAIEKIGGIVFGLARACIVASLALMTMAIAPLPYLQWSIREKSVTGMHILRVGTGLYEKAAGHLPALTLGGAIVDKEEVVQNIISDKAIAREAKRVSE